MTAAFIPPWLVSQAVKSFHLRDMWAMKDTARRMKEIVPVHAIVPFPLTIPYGIVVALLLSEDRMAVAVDACMNTVG